VLMASCASSGSRSSRRAAALTGSSRGCKPGRPRAPSPSWGTSPISHAWSAPFYAAPTTRFSSSAKARPACSTSPGGSRAAPPRSTGCSAPSICVASRPPMTERLSSLLGQPAPAAVARIALARLDEARAACARLDDRGDPEALHDFRVAVRRLRTLVRAFSGELGNAIPKKLERRIRDLARLTTAGRDADVQLAWIREVGARRSPGLAWFRTRLEDRSEERRV